MNQVLEAPGRARPATDEEDQYFQLVHLLILDAADIEEMIGIGELEEFSMKLREIEG